jgi:dTDP-4-dehydrorhamnose reductase
VKILVTGADGQLGRELRIKSAAIQADFVYTDLLQLNICDHAKVISAIKESSPDVLINCAAYTGVDKAEAEKPLAMAINSAAPKLLATICAERNILLIHFSTDYVFNGTKMTPYVETDLTTPSNEYALTKRLGEEHILSVNSKAVIIRTSWLYSATGNNFVKTMLRLLSKGTEFGVVFDQIGSPTYAGDLAETIIRNLPNFLDLKACELFHFSNEGAISWFDFAMCIRRLSESKTQIRPILSCEYPTAARRPPYSVLDKAKIKAHLQISIPDWAFSLERLLKNPTFQRELSV